MEIILKKIDLIKAFLYQILNWIKRNSILIWKFIRNKFGVNDKLTLVRQAIIYVYGWLIYPISLGIFNIIGAGILMFVIMFIILYFFIKISDKKSEEEGFILWLASFLFRNKFLILVILFIFEPFLFIVRYKNNYYDELGEVSKKRVIILTMVCSICSSLSWMLLLQYSGIGQIIWNFMKSLF